MTIAIKIENLSKHYRLGLVSTRTLSHDLNRWYQTTIRGKDDPYLKIGEVARERRSDTRDESDSIPGQQSAFRIPQSAIKIPMPHAPCPMPSSDYIWALRDINLEVQQGEVLGIIGKNGAGKSTLLKILSKVTAPTTGTVHARGRIASLLEVGTGFHPEMTGRENIYMNGAILGMSKVEISRKLDEIIDFAGVERFIDTPVKRYSSGMTVRLGFAVTAHLEPEILVVDEVLAVGDAEFQKKAIGKMQDISKGEGRTVLFVSHNMAAVSTLTNRAICLNDGEIIRSDTPQEVINFYLKETSATQGEYSSIKNLINPNFTNIKVKTSEANNVHINGEDLSLYFEVFMPYIIEGMGISFQIFSENRVPIIYGYIFDTNTQILRKKGYQKYKCTIPLCKLYEGKYYLKAHLAESRGRIKFEEIDGICQFEVIILGKNIEWGWQKNVCVYTEECIWEEIN